MKLKKVFFAFAGAVVFSLAACSKGDGNTSTNSGTNSQTTTTTQAESSALSFMGNNKIRVDVMDDLGVNFNYGNLAVVSTNEFDIVQDQKFSYSGNCKVDSINFIYYVERESGAVTNGTLGVDSDYFLSTILTRDNYNGVKKIYIAISTGTVKWTKGLSAELDQKLTAYVGNNSK